MLASKRLAPILDEFGAALYRSGELVIDNDTPALLVRRSAAAIDRPPRVIERTKDQPWDR
ncbi:hypothetical protein NJB1907f44_43120 [Mycobacterium marinum]|uniref:hypothetical protein n=1 Tax=Mycobacterium marinum TaxID=1781 RepID=UPI000E3D8795|nr:hypothetical protein [Mycobacterium marinum]RFZ43090.1 hypothetical protein KST_01223 [Mycobacterium marinum]GJN96232.1 hypothetical protein NJB1907E8_44880 [Mycobacterium marinum]GJO15576.1 hypothetical protein NJB1907E90_42410 [Mycobacterium marinum]GJO27199.1 hypothetical protein NJB1907E11_43320 [Mycobacterium marinum]GJO38393.1 hypothetical protein NJB1907f22_45660 [Mycobacterium marinum]